jgi:hypothetical protein
MEAFVATYPNSVVAEDALEEAMAAYQEAGDRGKVEATASRILQLDPDNVRALAPVVALMRLAHTEGQPTKKPATLRELADKGLKRIALWEKPEGMTERNFAKLRAQMKDIFCGAAGFAALQEKDYIAARDYYSNALDIDPNNLQDVYQLGIADLEMTSIDVRGFWYVARASRLVEQQGNFAVANHILAYGKANYVRYHGSEEGWIAILAHAANATAPPRDFRVEHAASPRQLQSSTQSPRTPASITSTSSPGKAHATPASILSLDTIPGRITPSASASILSSPNGKPAAVSALTSDHSNDAPAESASVLSPVNIGAGHEVPASITSSTVPVSAHRASHHKSLVPFGKKYYSPQSLPPVPIFRPAYSGLKR